MSFPLIVNPSPLQQLATTLQAIRERRMAFEDRRRQQEFEAARLMQMKQEGMLAERRLGLDEQRLTDARKNEDLDRQRQTMIDQRTQRQIDLAGRRQMEQDFLGSLPEGYTVTDPLVLSQLASRRAQAGKEYTTGVDPSVVSANAAMRSAEAIDVPGSLALAAQRAQPGERPVPGVANGIVYAPRPRSVSVSVGGSGGGPSPHQLNTGHRLDTRDTAKAALAYDEVRRSLSRLLSARDGVSRSASGTAAAYAFARLQEPGGRLSDRDVRNATAGGSFGEQASTIYNRLLRGEMDEGFVRSIEQAVEDLAEAQMGAYDNVTGTYIERATAAGVRFIPVDPWRSRRQRLRRPAPWTAGSGSGGPVVDPRFDDR